MKIDAVRASAVAEEIDDGRTAGSQGEHRTAEKVAEELERAGWTVERDMLLRAVEPEPVSRTIAFGAILAGSLLALTGWAGGFFLSTDPYTLAIGFGGLTALALLERWLRTGSVWVRQVQVPVVQATWPGQDGHPPALHVVILTSLDARRARRFAWLRWLLPVAEIAWALTLVLPCFWVGSWFWMGQAGPGLMIALGIMTLLARLGRRPAPRAADNRTGLAILIELARTWPGSARERIAPRLIAIGGPLQPRLSRLIPKHADPSTLVIVLDAPGVGTTLAIGGPEHRLAEQAAKDLWLPCRTGADCIAPAHVCVGNSSDEGQVDPALLVAAGQLVYEVTLRWARSKAASSVKDEAN